MIKVFDKDTTLLNMGLNNGIATLNEAFDVSIVKEINSTYVLTFSMPAKSDKNKTLTPDKQLLCEGQVYKIYGRSKSRNNEISRSYTAYSLLADLSQKLILTFPAMVAATPKEIMQEAIQGTGFEIVEVLPNGMEWVTDTTDFLDPQSKVTPLEIIKKLIEKLNCGEIYQDNYQIALVKEIKTNSNKLNLTPSFNLKSISNEENYNDVITRLYPFGKDDMTLSGNTPYIDSEMQSVFGMREGYKDYPDIQSQEELEELAEYEFSPSNPNRIDLPNLTYEISASDFSKKYGNKYKAGIGDYVKITDLDLEIETVQRIIKTVEYPYEPKESQLLLGNPPKTLSQEIMSLVNTKKQYLEQLDESGKIKTKWLENLVRNKAEYITQALISNEVVQHKTGDIWTFENQTGDKAIAIVDGTLAISDSKNLDGTWNWTSFIDGTSVTASVINSGTLNTNSVKLQSSDGKMEIQGNSFKMIADDGTTVSIRASADAVSGLSKGLQIIEKSDPTTGEPLNYSVYDADGYRRYIDGVRIQTYSIMSAGTAVVIGSARDVIACYAKLEGAYYSNWAKKYNSSDTSASEKKQMLNLFCSLSNTPDDDYFAKTEYKQLNFLKIEEAIVGKKINNTGIAQYYDYNGAAIFFNASYCYSGARSIDATFWELHYQIPQVNYFISTTMDV